LRAVLIQAAKAWRLKPSDLGLCATDDDIVYIVAWERTENLMTAWEQQEAAREAKRDAKNRA
jgi:hypothetical protein